MAEPLLAIENLKTYFHTSAGVARAVDGLSLTVDAGQTVGLVGESGCGKSVSALSILRLIAAPGRIEAGSRILFEGHDLLALDERGMRDIRGNRIAMIFQEPMTALNPVFSVGDQVAEVARIHDHASRADAWKRALDMLDRVGIPAPDERAREYPHQLSGGMRQRVMIAMALMMRPALLIADEPTTALDVTIQAQILELLMELRQQYGMSVLLITHDFGVVAETADHVTVMYGGEAVEQASVHELFAHPHHPYTRGLLAAMPRLGSARDRLRTIPGSVPAPTDWPAGCRFRDRCASAWERCEREHPRTYDLGAAHHSRCHLADEPGRRAPDDTDVHAPAARP